MSKAFYAVGRFQPPTIGHAKMIESLIQMSKDAGARPFVFVSSAQGTGKERVKNPLTSDVKVSFLRKMFPSDVEFVDTAECEPRCGGHGSGSQRDPGSRSGQRRRHTRDRGRRDGRRHATRPGHAREVHAGGAEAGAWPTGALWTRSWLRPPCLLQVIYVTNVIACATPHSPSAALGFCTSASRSRFLVFLSSPYLYKVFSTS